MTTPKTDPMGALLAGVKQFLAELPEKDYAALVAEVRPPAEADTGTPAPKGDGPAPKGNPQPAAPSYPAAWGYGR